MGFFKKSEIPKMPTPDHDIVLKSCKNDDCHLVNKCRLHVWLNEKKDDVIMSEFFIQKTCSCCEWFEKKDFYKIFNDIVGK